MNNFEPLGYFISNHLQNMTPEALPFILALGALGLVAAPALVVLFFVVIAWSVVWKGIALWIAAREKNKWWFIALLVINTVGILDILYIFVFSKWGQEWRKRKFGKKDTKDKEEVLGEN